MKHSLFFSVSFVAITCLSELAIAQDQTAEGEQALGKPIPQSTTTQATPGQKDTRLKPGVISSYGKFPRSTQIDQVSGDTIGQESPITGSVSFSKNGCVATVRNGSKQSSYSVSFEVDGVDASGNRAVHHSYSATLKPQESTSRTVDCTRDLNMAVILKSGRKLN